MGRTHGQAIHELEHRGAVDIVNIPVADLARRRLLITTRGGEELAIALPREKRLFDGAVLLIDKNRAIVVRAATERWLRLEPHSIGDAIELGYHAGNLHWRVRFGGDVLFVALEGRPEDYTSRLAELISACGQGDSLAEAMPCNARVAFCLLLSDRNGRFWRKTAIRQDGRSRVWLAVILRAPGGATLR